MKKNTSKIRVILAFICSVLVFSSCKDNLEPALDKPDPSRNEDPIVLGKKTTSPYSVNTMQKVRELLQQQPGAGSSSKRIEAVEFTHLYVKFKPGNGAEAAVLIADSSLRLFNYPLDRQILKTGQYYKDENTGEDELNYYYSVLPSDYKFNSVSYEILDSLYLPEKIEPIEDYAAHYITGNLDEAPVPVPDEENIPGETYLYLPPYEENGISIEALSNKRTNLFGVKIRLPLPTYPSGRVTVADNRLGLVGVPGVQVQVVHLGRIIDGETDINGNFRINTGFFVGTHVTVLFNNGTCLIKPFDTGGTWARTTASLINLLVTGAIHNEGFRNKDGLSNMNISFQANNQARYWSLIKVAVARFNLMAQQNGIGTTPPGRLVIYAHWAKNDGAASAPMLNFVSHYHTANKLYETLLKDIDVVFNTDLVQSISMTKPDITIKANSNIAINTDRVMHTMFHELAHASHCRSAGQTFWAEYIKYIVENSGYGNIDNAGSGRIALSEAWAEYVGDRFFNIRYAGGRVDGLVSEERSSNDEDITMRWIPYGIYHDLVDNVNFNEPFITIRGVNTQVIDNVQGFTPGQMYSVLSPTVTSPQSFRAALISRFGSAQSTQLTQLFTSYGHP